MLKLKQPEKDKQIVRKANVRGRIKKVTYFTEAHRKYAIVVNKVAGLYAIRLINYEDEDEIKIKAVKRFPDLIGFYKLKEEANEEVEKISGNQELINQCIYEFETHEDDAENLLIIGRTGGGKSTLANVISGSDNFGESGNSFSKTKNFQIGNFEWEGTKYRVVDTIGIGDTQLSKEDVLYKIGEAIHSMKKGIKQVFVVVGGRFTKEELETFDLLKKAIFGTDIIKYTTIIRTKFEDFELSDECNMDKDTLKKQNPKIADLINSCNGIIYVNNPPLSSKSRLEMNEKDRKNSRERLLVHLKSFQGNYKVENWDTICVRINDFVNARRWREEHEGLGGLFLKKELDGIKKEVIEEVNVHLSQLRVQETEVQASLEIPFTARIDLMMKHRGDCCSIL